MAVNRIPLIVPCHRVVCSNGRVGAYSAPGGVRTKRRLLALEMRFPIRRIDLE
jgi:methylated-DNA-[protein]-cysteine S-methyltransferase